MRFELTILGSGSALPISNRHTTAQVLNVLERFFLIDCGEGTQHQIRKNKISIGKINHILISHLHGDHFYGLFGLISTMALLGRTQELHIYGPPLLKDLIDCVLQVQDSNPAFLVRFYPLNFDQPCIIYSDKSVEVHSFPLKHSAPVCGFLFREKPRERKINPECIGMYQLTVAEMNALKAGKDIVRNQQIIPNRNLTLDPLAPRSYVFMTDTVPSKKYLHLIRDADVIYHESTFLHAEKLLARQTAHSTAFQAAKLAAETNARALLLGHFSARYKEVSEFDREARQVLPESKAVIDGDRITWFDQNNPYIIVERNGEVVFTS